jgi:hypothetical protein
MPTWKKTLTVTQREENWETKKREKHFSWWSGMNENGVIWTLGLYSKSWPKWSLARR